jgi:hypothetical protein
LFRFKLMFFRNFFWLSSFVAWKDKEFFLFYLKKNFCFLEILFKFSSPFLLSIRRIRLKRPNQIESGQQNWEKTNMNHRLLNYNFWSLWYEPHSMKTQIRGIEWNSKFLISKLGCYQTECFKSMIWIEWEELGLE